MPITLRPASRREAAKITAIATVVVATIALTGCSAASTTNSDSSQIAASLKGKISGSITYESWSPTADEMKSVVAGFSKVEPKVKVSTQLLPYANYLTSIKSELASGSGPDVFQLPAGAYLNEFSGFIQPISPYASASLGSKWESLYRSQAITGVKSSKGVALGLPAAPFGIAGILWANKTILAKYDLPLPTTYADLKSDADVLRSNGIAPIAFGAKDSFQLDDFYLALANDLNPKETAAAYHGTGKWTTPDLVKAFAEFKQLFTDKDVQDGALGDATYNDTYNLFLNQQAAFLANGSWNMDMFVNSAAAIGKMDVAVIPLPAPEATNGYKVVGDSGALVINLASKNKAAAYKLVEYMSKGGGAQILTNSFLDPGTLTTPLTPQSTLTANATSVRDEINKLVANNLAGRRDIDSATTQDALSQAIQALLAGSTDPAGAAKQVQAAADGN